MSNNAVKDGWQRFLDRLRRMWGKPRGAGTPGTAVSAAVAHARG
jgi:hypothetical protein